MNDLLNKTPKPLIVLVVLCAALAFFIYNDPPKDECEIQGQVFERNTRGLIKGTKVKGKIQFPLLEPMKDKCKLGNSPGSCEDYLESLARITAELKSMKDKCIFRYVEENEFFKTQIIHAVQVMSLVAWGEKPPESLSERMGWYNESHVKTFCLLKRTLLKLVTEEEYASVRNRVYLEYPDVWDEKSLPTDGVEDKRLAENRPRAFKSGYNPKGRFDAKQIFEKSLFSVRCDMFQ